MIKIEVKTEIKPTEDPDKVKRAILNIIEPEEIKEEEDYRRIIIAESRNIKSLNKLHSLIRRERILDSARKTLKELSTKEKVIFHLNKQAAYMNHISFSQPENESPLGPITIEITSKNPKKIIDWLAPPTSKGKPIFEIKPPKEE